MELMEYFIQRASLQPKRIVFPESNDERILKTAELILQRHIAHPILIGDDSAVREQSRQLGINLDGVNVISPVDSPQFGDYVARYCAQRDNVTEKIAEKLLKKPLLFGAMMVAQGDADGVVCGVAHATASVIQAASLTVGFAPGVSNPSSLFIMVVPEFLGERDKIFVFADCAVTIKPTAEQLAEIAIVTGRNVRRLLQIEPKIAMLSFSTKGSASHEEADKVIRATELARQMAPELAIDGELQADAAIVPRVAQKKVKESPVAGQCNVLIFPDLNSGNIAYKLVQYLGKAKAFGPFLQGFAKPISDLSRGASVEDIVGVTAVTAVQAQ
ncbi:MAG: phosphate acetyltransferase [candidate division KSB1 bacterium]|nr:phosphate acetyltransferase [candidate division KSB1 bacterium]MDZ7358027.1 phosphate acetyltransferase [candidate division KSB1 bacterium]